jgi:hypothetical protein
MKRLFIIDTYPSGDLEIDALNRCIDSLQASDYHVLVVSHLPLDVETAKKVEYVIYDNNNTFLSPEYTPFFWFTDKNFVVKINIPGHALPICRNMTSALHLAKAMGYEQFVFTECDVIFNIEDLRMLEAWMDQMVNENKKMLFFKPEGYRYNDSYVYETLLFGGEIQYFLDTFIPPITEEEWLAKNMGHSLELSFYEKFVQDEERFLILNDHSSNILTKSDVNILRYGLFNCELLYNETDNHLPILFIMNALIGEEFKTVDVFQNGELIHSTAMGKNHYWYRMFSPDDSQIVINVYNDDAKTSLFMTKTLICNNDIIKDKATIKFE